MWKQVFPNFKKEVKIIFSFEEDGLLVITTIIDVEECISLKLHDFRFWDEDKQKIVVMAHLWHTSQVCHKYLTFFQKK